MITVLLLIFSYLPSAGVQAAPEWDVNSPSLATTASLANISVDEGTWMSLDVSPDGKHIAFDLLGDIYQIPFAGGEAEPLLSGHPWEIQPRYSPDGKSIAFTSDRAGGDNIWVMNLQDRDLRPISNEKFRLLNNPSWSPDGNYIAARKHFTTSRSLGVGEIWLYHSSGLGGAKGVQVVERPSPKFQKELGEPMFAPDGKSIYFSQNSTPGDTFIYHQDSNKEVFQIKKVELATATISKVIGGPGGAVRPTPSPDGKYIAYIKRVRAISRLFVMELASGKETMLVDKMDQDMQETWAIHGVYPNMDWTPDSKKIVYWTAGKIWSIDIISRETINIAFQVTDSRQIYPAPRYPIDVAPNKFNTKMVRFAKASPDGKNIVFESLGTLFIKRQDKTIEKLTTDKLATDNNLDAGFDYAPIWSPDGKNIYFMRWSDTNLSTIRRVRSNGGKSAQLNREQGQYVELSISADGTTLAYRKLAGSAFLNPEWAQNPGIYTMSIDDRETHFVATAGTKPQLQTDQRIYFIDRKSSSGRATDDAKTELLSMTIDGNDIRTHAESEFATDIQISPNGKYIAFLENFQVYVSTFPTTGKPIELGPEQEALPAARVSDIGGIYIDWSTDSTNISWTVGAEFKSVNIADALFRSNQPPAINNVNLSQAIDAEKPAGILALIGARLLTMDADRTVIESGTIIISENRIVAIGARDDVSIPVNAKTIDLSGKTIVPGFIDAHAHGPQGRNDIIPQQNWDSLAHLALGVTTIHDPSNRATEIFAAAEYSKAGHILSPRIFSTGEIVYGAKSRNWAKIDNYEDALMHIRRLKAQGAYSVKNYNQPNRSQRQQVIEASRQERMMSVAEGGSLFHMDMSLIADGITGIEHNVPTLKMYDDITQFWQQSTAGYTPTLVVTYGGLTSEDYFYEKTEVWKHPILSRFVPPTVLQPMSVRRMMAPENDYKDDDSAASAKVLMEAGVIVNTGAHGQREGLGTHWEMWSFVRGGMSPMQALAAATVNPATYLGMDNDLGSLETGKLADMVVMRENPLTDIRKTDKISHVVLNGRVYKAKTLSEVTTGNSNLRPFWWQNSPQGLIR